MRALYSALAAGCLVLAAPLGAVAAAASASEIRLGQTAQGTLTTRDLVWVDDSYYDVYRFRAEAGTWVTITMDSTDMDTYLHLRKAGEQGYLKRDDDAGEGNNAKIEAFIPVSGDYEIIANGSSSSDLGAYAVKLVQSSAPSGSRMRVPQNATARTIAVGETLRGALSASDPAYSTGSPYHLFRMKGVKGQEITIDLKSSAFDAELTLRRAGEVGMRDNNDDGGSGTNAQISYTPKEDEDLEIVVSRSTESGTGDFSLSVASGSTDDDDDEDEVDVTPIAYGRTIEGRLGEGDNLDDDVLWFDSYSFAGRAGDNILITVEATGFDPLVELYNPDDDKIAEDDDGGEGLNSRLERRLTESGTYFIDVRSADDDDTGTYTLKLVRQ